MFNRQNSAAVLIKSKTVGMAWIVPSVMKHVEAHVCFSFHFPSFGRHPKFMIILGKSIINQVKERNTFPLFRRSPPLLLFDIKYAVECKTERHVARLGSYQYEPAQRQSHVQTRGKILWKSRKSQSQQRLCFLLATMSSMCFCIYHSSCSIHGGTCISPYTSLRLQQFMGAELTSTLKLCLMSHLCGLPHSWRSLARSSYFKAKRVASGNVRASALWITGITSGFGAKNSKGCCALQPV